MRPWISCWASVCALLLFVSESSAKVIVKENTVYYSVSGRTGQEIYGQMTRKGPKIPGHKDHKIAATTMVTDVMKLDGGVKGNQCVVTRADVSLKVTYRIPKWTGGKSASAATQKAWDAFLAHVWRHERRHAEIALEHARQLERGLLALRGDVRKDCKDMIAAAERLSKKTVESHHRKQDAFDASWFGDGGKQYRHDRVLQAAK
ncbi:MAG: DUF922 domain-containing protein [Mesorhizobium sp.]|nr:DUF922 domain-containing protein [Mesorhizobium sp.]